MSLTPSYDTMPSAASISAPLSTMPLVNEVLSPSTIMPSMVTLLALTYTTIVAVGLNGSGFDTSGTIFDSVARTPLPAMPALAPTIVNGRSIVDAPDISSRLDIDSAAGGDRVDAALDGDEGVVAEHQAGHRAGAVLRAARVPGHGVAGRQADRADVTGDREVGDRVLADVTRCGARSRGSGRCRCRLRSRPRTGSRPRKSSHYRPGCQTRH